MNVILMPHSLSVSQSKLKSEMKCQNILTNRLPLWLVWNAFKGNCMLRVVNSLTKFSAIGHYFATLFCHTLLTHSFDTLFCHTILTHYFDTPFWHTILTHYFDTLFWHTILTHHFDTLFWLVYLVPPLFSFLLFVCSYS